MCWTSPPPSLNASRRLESEIKVHAGAARRGEAPAEMMFPRGLAERENGTRRAHWATAERRQLVGELGLRAPPRLSVVVRRELRERVTREQPVGGGLIGAPGTPEREREPAPGP